MLGGEANLEIEFSALKEVGRFYKLGKGATLADSAHNSGVIGPCGKRVSRLTRLRIVHVWLAPDSSSRRGCVFPIAMASGCELPPHIHICNGIVWCPYEKYLAPTPHDGPMVMLCRGETIATGTTQIFSSSSKISHNQR